MVFPLRKCAETYFDSVFFWLPRENESSRDFANFQGCWKLEKICEKHSPLHFMLCFYFHSLMIFTLDYIYFLSFSFSLNKSFICFLCSLIHHIDHEPPHKINSFICCANTPGKTSTIIFYNFPQSSHKTPSTQFGKLRTLLSAPKSCFMIFCWIMVNQSTSGKL